VPFGDEGSEPTQKKAPFSHWSTIAKFLKFSDRKMQEWCEQVEKAKEIALEDRE
jgi:hypothetical protein